MGAHRVAISHLLIKTLYDRLELSYLVGLGLGLRVGILGVVRVWVSIRVRVGG